MKRVVWKLPFVRFFFLKKKVFNKNNKVIFTKDRSSTIIRPFITKKLCVYSGKSFKTFIINNFMVGHKFGEFSFTKIRGSAITESLILKGKLKRKEKVKAKSLTKEKVKK